MTEEDNRRDRRQRPRVPADGDISAQIPAGTGVPVINISDTGALIEVPISLRPGALYVLRLDLGPGRILMLKSRVVRSYVQGWEEREGERVVNYRAALTFLDVPEHERQILRSQLGDIEVSIELELPT